MRLSILLAGGLLIARAQSFEIRESSTRSTTGSLVVPIAHLAAADGGRFIISRTTGPELPLENPFQAIHSGSGIAISTDGGSRFTALEVPGISQVNSVAFGTKSPGLLYALGDNGSFALTRDQGLSWQTYRSSGETLALSTEGRRFMESEQIVVDPRDEALVYRRLGFRQDAVAGSLPPRITRWIYEQNSFVPVTNLPPDAFGPFMRPRSIQLFAATPSALYVSMGPLGAWEAFSVLPSVHRARDVVFDVAGTRRIYVLTEDGAILRTNDDGGGWQTVTLADRALRMAANPNRAGHLLLLTRTQAFLSTDGGATVTRVDVPWKPDSDRPVQIEFDAANPDVVYAEGRRRISLDAGRTWRDNAPGRIGFRVCSAIEPNRCYALDERFENFYIEKLDADGVRQWASYWGDDDPATPRSAFVDRYGDLWLSTGRKVARVSAGGELLEVRPAPELILELARLADGRLVALLGGSRIGLLDPVSLAPQASSIVELPGLAAKLAVFENRIAVLSSRKIFFYLPEESRLEAAGLPADFDPIALEWASTTTLLIAGNTPKSADSRLTKVDIYAWTAAGLRNFATLEADRSESIEAIAVDSIRRVWLLGSTSSQRFPQRAPLWHGPAKNSVSKFVTLLPEGGGTPLFSTYLPEGVLPLTCDLGLCLVAPGRGDRVSGNPFFLQSPYSSYAPVQLHRGGQTALTIDGIERRFDASGGNWSRGGWLRIRSVALQDLEVMQLPVWSQDRPTIYQGTRALLDGEALTILGAGPGFLDVAVDPLTSDENGTDAKLVLERNGALSQVMRLIVDRFDFEILPRQDQAEIALAYNADGSENSELNPALAGSQITLFAVGALGTPVVYLNPERVGDFDPSDVPTYVSDYVDDVSGVLPGIRYIGLTLRGLGKFTGTRKVGLYRYYEDQPSLAVWVRGN